MNIGEGFKYSGPQQNFERDSYTTLAEMKAVKPKKMPRVFIATCEETGKLYIYNFKNESDGVLGKWREVGSEDKITDELIEHLLYQFETLPTKSTESFPIKTGTRIYNSTDKKMYIATVASDDSVSWKSETSDSPAVQPSIEPPAISISSEGKVTITCSTSGAVIYYTIDNNIPVNSFSRYTTSFNVENDTTIKAMAVKDDVFSTAVSMKYVTKTTEHSDAPNTEPSHSDEPSSSDDDENKEKIDISFIFEM